MSEMARKLKAYADRRRTERERKRKNVEKEDFLLNQIDEFREKAKQLQALLTSKESKVQQLQEIVEEREGKARELSDMLEERQDVADRVVAGMEPQLSGVAERLEAKLNELNKVMAERLAENVVNAADQSEEIRALIQESAKALTEAVNGLDGQFDKVKGEICEKIHTEDVKCYRNIQTLFEESDKKLLAMEEQIAGLRSAKTMLKSIMTIAILNFAGLAGLFAYLYFYG